MQLSQLRTRVLPVFLQACDSPKPAVRVILDSGSIEASQTLGKFNGRWYLHLTESLQSVAERFQRVFH